MQLFSAVPAARAAPPPAPPTAPLPADPTRSEQGNPYVVTVATAAPSPSPDHTPVRMAADVALALGVDDYLPAGVSEKIQARALLKVQDVVAIQKFAMDLAVSVARSSAEELNVLPSTVAVSCVYLLDDGFRQNLLAPDGWNSDVCDTVKPNVEKTVQGSLYFEHLRESSLFSAKAGTADKMAFLGRVRAALVDALGLREDAVQILDISINAVRGVIVDFQVRSVGETQSDNDLVTMTKGGLMHAARLRGSKLSQCGIVDLQRSYIGGSRIGPSPAEPPSPYVLPDPTAVPGRPPGGVGVVLLIDTPAAAQLQERGGSALEAVKRKLGWPKHPIEAKISGKAADAPVADVDVAAAGASVVMHGVTYHPPIRTDPI